MLLHDCGLQIEDLRATVTTIQENQRYRPFDKKMPMLKSLVFSVGTLLTQLVYLYVALILL